eukprot:s2960_g6.t1
MAILAQEPWDLAVEQVQSVRRTLDLPGMIGEAGMLPWVEAVIKTHPLREAAILTHPVRNPFPLPCGYLAGSEVHLEWRDGQILCSCKQPSNRVLRLVEPLRARARLEAMAWNRSFCSNCLVPAARARITTVLAATSLTVPEDHLPIAKKLCSASGFGGTVRAISGGKDHGCMAFDSFPFRRPMELQAWLGLTAAFCSSLPRPTIHVLWIRAPQAICDEKRALIATKIQNLEEFRFLFEDETKIGNFLSKLQLGEDKLVQGARLRRAWTAVMLYYKTQDQDRFWARDRIQQKLLGLMATAEATDRLTPGAAAKIYGIANFFEQGVWGRIGCGGCRFLAASDAALEAPKMGTGGFLLVWHSPGLQLREAFISVIPPSVYSLWEPGDKKIAQLELLQVLYALFARPTKFRDCRGLWFIDNTAALMAPIRGRSDNPDLEIFVSTHPSDSLCAQSLVLVGMDPQ